MYVQVQKYPWGSNRGKRECAQVGWQFRNMIKRKKGPEEKMIAERGAEGRERVQKEYKRRVESDIWETLLSMLFVNVSFCFHDL